MECIFLTGARKLLSGAPSVFLCSSCHGLYISLWNRSASIFLWCWRRCRAVRSNEWARVTIIIEKATTLVWFSLFTAILLARISQSRNSSYLASRIGAYWDEGTKHIVYRDRMFLLEFRLIVFPNPPLRNIEISVSLHTRNKKGERDNIPLELTPMLSSQVAAYLTFRAILPPDYLVLPEESRLEPGRKVPRGAVDVYIRALDTGSDKSIHIYRQYMLPDEVRSGAFKDAVVLGDNDIIDRVISENLESITYIDGDQ